MLGSFIVHDPKDPYLKDYDEEYTVLINWWYHNESSVLLESLFSPGDGVSITEPFIQFAIPIAFLTLFSK